MEIRKHFRLLLAAFVPLLCIILLALFFLPLYLLLPRGAQASLYKIGYTVASSIRYLGDLDVFVGSTCDQSRQVCIRSFILEGRFDVGDGERFRAKIRDLTKEHRDIDTICLNSKGGYNQEAALIGKEIRAHKLNTCVGDMPLRDTLASGDDARYTASCESACTFVLLAGKERIALGDRFQFGIHANKALFEIKDSSSEMAKNARGLRDNSPKANSFMSQYAERDIIDQYGGMMYISTAQLDAILAKMRQTPGSKRYYLSAAEQMEMGYFTQRR